MAYKHPGYKLAIIGFGGVAGYHESILAKHFAGKIDVVGAYDVREEARAKAKGKGLYVYGTPAEIYADKSIDIVLISTPNDVHKAYSISCLEAGKSVICEKPVAMDSNELMQIIEAAAKADGFFTVHQNRRWDRDYLVARKAFEDGLLHDPYIIESRVQGSRQTLHGWRGWKQNGGGMVLDWGVHLLDQMLDWMQGKVVGVSAVLHKVFAPQVDDNFTASFRFDSGVNYIVNVSMNAFILQPRWHIFAKDGTAIIENWECEGKIVKLADTSSLSWEEDIVYTAAGPTRSMAPRPSSTVTELPLPELPAPPTQAPEFYRNIVAKLDGREELVVKPDQCLRVMRLIDLVFESDAMERGLACEI